VTAYFLDSSALVKRYVPEPGTAWVRTITTPSADNTVLVAQMIPAEVISGVWRRVRKAPSPHGLRGRSGCWWIAIHGAWRAIDSSCLYVRCLNQ
jgi:hypothetical protein